MSLLSGVNTLELAATVSGLIMLLGTPLYRVVVRLQRLEWIAETRGQEIARLAARSDEHERLITSIHLRLERIDGNLERLLEEIKRQ